MTEPWLQVGVEIWILTLEHHHTKMNKHLFSNLGIALTYPREACLCMCQETGTFRAALFTPVKNWKQPTCPGTGERRDEWIAVYAKEYHSAVSMSEWPQWLSIIGIIPCNKIVKKTQKTFKAGHGGTYLQFQLLRELETGGWGQPEQN
jgi:hypothetical protein